MKRIVVSTLLLFVWLALVVFVPRNIMNLVAISISGWKVGEWIKDLTRHLDHV